MGAVVKNPITQLAQASVPGPTRALFVDESLARIPTITSKEIRSLSQFLPVIVLIHKSTIKKFAVREMTDSKSLTETSESTKLLGLFGQAVNLLETADTNNVVVFGDVIVNFSALEVHRKGRPVVLTALEFKTLKYFIQNARRAISRDELLNEVWGYQNYPCTRTVDNHILKLRQKLERDSSRPVHFRTVHGAGYKFLP
jgi:two-component system, OmpR family, alkaline phosphatase synthesis response regulator PhoP